MKLTKKNQFTTLTMIMLMSAKSTLAAPVAGHGEAHDVTRHENSQPVQKNESKTMTDHLKSYIKSISGMEDKGIIDSIVGKKKDVNNSAHTESDLNLMEDYSNYAANESHNASLDFSAKNPMQTSNREASPQVESIYEGASHNEPSLFRTDNPNSEWANKISHQKALEITLPTEKLSTQQNDLQRDQTTSPQPAASRTYLQFTNDALKNATSAFGNRTTQRTTTGSAGQTITETRNYKNQLVRVTTKDPQTKTIIIEGKNPYNGKTESIQTRDAQTQQVISTQTIKPDGTYEITDAQEKPLESFDGKLVTKFY